MDSYQETCNSFTWDQARATLDGLPNDRGLNIAYEAVDRHVNGGRGHLVAIRWLPKSGETVDVTYAELARRTNRFAGALHQLGYRGGHGVATLSGRVLDLYVAALGTLKGGGVYTPLFSAFGPDPIAMRMNLGRIDVLVTTAVLYRRKVAALRLDLPHLKHVLLIGGGASEFDDSSVVDLDELLASAPDHFDIPPTDPESRALLHFTSGTTGEPKGAIHVHEAVVAHAATGQMVLDLKAGDIFWCTADPGWVTGTSYGIISPLVNGVTSIVDEAEFDAERWYRTLQDQRVNVFYTAPTALRMLQRVGAEAAADFDLPALRLVASVGEPLDPESVQWARDVFGVPVLDNWWQTETGGIMVANYRTELVKPGSMGRPVPGISVGLLRCDEEGEIERDHGGKPIEITATDEVGELSIEVGWPSMFRGYLDQDERYAQSFDGGWYHSGDLARRDADGYYWFVGRNNDVIKSAGHLIGPFEVESALTEHPAVVEAAVIGKPEPTVGAVVKAFVVLAAGYQSSEELRRELLGHARKRLGAAVAPREVDFVDDLPHTRSGKIMRRLLKARELGLDEGDVSTLEHPMAAGPDRTFKRSSSRQEST
ncbi:MAG: acetyl-CoA synthetase [Acidimicrobiales bacterium]